MTASCFDDEKLRLVYIAAQVTRIDLKIDLAIIETMRIYKRVVGSAVGAAFVPGGSSTNRVTVAIVVCKAIVASFGTPTVSAATIQEIVKSIIWDDVEHNFAAFLAELSVTGGFLGFLVTGIPFFLVSGAVNVPLVVPATARLFLMLACDVILILTKAYRQCTDKCLAQPLQKDIENAAFAYRNLSKRVHKDVKKLVPMSNALKSFRAEKIKVGFEAIIETYKLKFAEEIAAGRNLEVSDSDANDSDVAIMEAKIKTDLDI